MKKRIKVILVVVLAILIVGGIYFFNQKPESVITTAVVEKGDLKQTVEVTGDVATIDNLDLAFDASGTVASVNVQIGDLVKAGDLLASLKSAELQSAVDQAEQTVVQAQAEIDLKQAGVSLEEQAVTEANLLVAQTALEAIQAVADAGLVEENASLANIKINTAQDLSDSQADILESMRSVMAKVRSGLADADTILGVDNTLFNDEFEQYLGNQDTQSIYDAEDAFVSAEIARDSAEDLLSVLDISDDEALDLAVEGVDKAYSLTYQSLLETSKVLDSTEVDTTNLSSADLIVFKTTISTAQSALMTAGSAFVNAEQALRSARLAVTQDVLEAEHSLASAQANYDQDLANAKANISLLEAKLAQTLADPRAVELASLLAGERIAEAQYNAALARLRQTQIVSPIDGQVVKINSDVGEQATIGQSMITVLSSGKTFEITLDIPESDIAKIQVDQTASITLDAFGDEVSFSGQVVTINPAEKLIEGVVFYQAKIFFNDQQDLSAIKPGMSAVVTILTSSETNVLYVPSRSVLERDGVKYVRVPNGTAFTEKTVTVGLRADDGLVEIISGLSVGEEVIVSIR